MALRVTYSAEREIRQALSWWRRNRAASPDLLLEELRRALELITAQPLVGSPLADSTLGAVRKVILVRTRYMLFYRTRNAEHTEVLALWHSSRGRRPNL